MGWGKKPELKDFSIAYPPKAEGARIRNGTCLLTKL